jgi:hypothetical protein
MILHIPINENYQWTTIQKIIVVLLSFWHKLNYFLFCCTFEKNIIICVKILIKSKVQLLGFEP